MFHAVNLSYLLSLHGLVTVLALFLYVMASHALQQRRHPSAAIGWVLFIVLLPYVALPFYLVFGTRKITRSDHIAAALGPGLAAGGTWLARITGALGQPAALPYADLRIHADGAQALHALLELIDGARVSLDLCTFILRRDAVGVAVAEHLAARARAGVRVRVLLDGVGRMMGGWADLSAMRGAGVQVGYFVPSLRTPFKGRVNLRNHRKLVVADAGLARERLWCGGRNLATEYFEGEAETPPWHDLTFDLRGPVARQAAELFQRDWVFSMGEPPRERAAGAPGPASMWARFRDTAAHPSVWPASVAAAAQVAPAGTPVPFTAQVISSGPDQADDSVHALLVAASYRAARRIALVSPYVVPDDSLLMALCLAARRGVMVDLLMPARSNHRLADAARHRSLRALAAAGARVWLVPRMLHAKAAIFDDDLAFGGSTNLDGRSLFLNYELMVAFNAPAEVARFARWFEDERAGAQRYVLRPPGLMRDIAEGMLLWVGFQM